MQPISIVPEDVANHGMYAASRVAIVIASNQRW